MVQLHTVYTQSIKILGKLMCFYTILSKFSNLQSQICTGRHKLSTCGNKNVSF